MVDMVRIFRSVLHFITYFFLCTLMTRIMSHNAEVFKLLLRNERQIIQLLEISGLMKRKEALIRKEEDKIPRKRNEDTHVLDTTPSVSLRFG